MDALACVAGVEGEGKEKNRLHETRNTQAMDAIYCIHVCHMHSHMKYMLGRPWEGYLNLW